MESVKFVIDTEGGNVTHLLSTADWSLHYTFVREIIEGLDPLDRCDPEEARIFREGWVAFSEQNYTQVASDLGIVLLTEGDPALSENPSLLRIAAVKWVQTFDDFANKGVMETPIRGAQQMGHIPTFGIDDELDRFHSDRGVA